MRIPRFGKLKKKRVSAMVIVCAKCLCTAPSVAKISKSLCIGGTGRNLNSSRRKFLAKLKEAAQGDYAPELLAGVRRILEVLQPDAATGAATSSAQPEAQADHDVEAVTWPVPCKTGYKCEVRFICTRCRSTLLLSSRARVTLQLPGISTRRKACVPSFPLPSVKADFVVAAQSEYGLG